jgi:hypothetical protein
MYDTAMNIGARGHGAICYEERNNTSEQQQIIVETEFYDSEPAM